MAGRVTRRALFRRFARAVPLGLFIGSSSEAVVWRMSTGGPKWWTAFWRRMWIDWVR